VDQYLPSPASYVERALLRDRISDLDPKVPVVVPPTMPLQDVIRLMVQRNIGCVLVVDQERLQGVFSERDVLTRIGIRAHELANHPISEFATPDPYKLDTNAKIAYAVRMMDLGGYRHVPILDGEGRPSGIISVRDILRYLTDCMAPRVA
jgi:CBS domain-containing protein